MTSFIYCISEGGKIENKPPINPYNQQIQMTEQPPMPPPSMPPPPPSSSVSSSSSNSSYPQNGDKKDRKRKSRWDD